VTETNKKVSKAAGVVGAMTLLSRVFGMIRDIVIAMMFGASQSADAFFVAFRIPNVQRRLLGEGAVSAAFIPVFTEILNQKGEKAAWDITSNLIKILSLMLLTMTLIIVIGAPVVVTLFAPGFIGDPIKFDLTVRLTRWMGPYLFFVGIGALLMGVLNTFHVFAIPAAAPVLLNISMIASALLVAPHLEEPILGLAFGVLAGGLLQILFQIPASLKTGLTLSPPMDWRNKEIVRMGKLMVPIILGLAVYEVNLVVDTLLASLLPEGSISYLYYGNRLVQLPLGIFGVAMGIAILPSLSMHAAQRDYPELIKTLAFGIRLILFITIPATLGLIILRYPIVQTLWERGEFTSVSTEGTAIALLYYSVGLCAFAGIKVVAPAFFSLQDTKTPVRIAIYAMVLNIVLNLILMVPLKHGGLALATSISALFNVLMLIHHLRKRLGLLGGRKILESTLKLMAAAGVMAAVTFYCNQAFFDIAAPLGVKVGVLLGCILGGIIAFGFTAKVLKNEELDFLIELGRRKKAPNSRKA